MTYEEAIDKICSFQKYGSKLELDRIYKLMDLLGNPQNKMKIIHVAGTNGKGSVCRYIYSVLQENGYKVGLYTSPYLERFTERFEYNGKEISHEDLAKYTEEVIYKVEAMMAEGYESPTEFEFITAIGFLYFAGRDIDFLVLEVGLGGTGDSTNIIEKPLASVIASISYDHMAQLGDTLEKIALEKAGIIKNGVPVIINVADEGASKAIKEVALSKNCKLYDVSKTNYNNLEKAVEGYTFDTVIENEDYKRISISMIGIHQVANAICALTVIEVLKNEKLISVDKKKIYNGIYKARQNGRFEVLKKKPYIIIDGAHNEDGAESFRRTMNDHFPDSRILMVVGVLADKKIDRIIDNFRMVTDEFVATEPDNPRKLSSDELCRQVQGAGSKCIAIEKAEDACSYVNEKLSSYDVIAFAGSLYLIGKVRGILKNEEK